MRSTRSILRSMLVAGTVLGIASKGSPQNIGGITTDRTQADQRMDTDWSGWAPPISLGATINSPSDEPQVAITHSGLSLYFASDRPGTFGLLDLWVSHRTSLDAPWGEPRNLGSLINSPSFEYCPSFSRDDHWMFYSSARAGGFGRGDIYMTYRLDATDDFGWQQPVNLGPSINSPYGDYDPIYFVDPGNGEATLYFISNRPVLNGKFDIYQSTRNADGSFAPAVVNRELSSPYDDRRMTIRKDGLELIFTSDRPSGMGGLDLWVSTRDDTHEPWGEPVNLGPTINSVADERGSALSNDGRTLYFSSDRPGGLGGGDLWSATRIRESVRHQQAPRTLDDGGGHQ